MLRVEHKIQLFWLLAEDHVYLANLTPSHQKCTGLRWVWHLLLTPIWPSFFDFSSQFLHLLRAAASYYSLKLWQKNLECLDYRFVIVWKCKLKQEHLWCAKCKKQQCPPFVENLNNSSGGEGVYSQCQGEQADCIVHHLLDLLLHTPLPSLPWVFPSPTPFYFCLKCHPSSA